MRKVIIGCVLGMTVILATVVALAQPAPAGVTIGQKIGVLTAEKTAGVDPVDGKPQHVWRCSCGRKLTIKDELVKDRKHANGEPLHAGAIPSCGQFWKDRVK